MANPTEILIQRGKTFKLEVRWAKADHITYKPITGATQTAPLRLKVVGHGIPPGWPAAVTNMKGMVEINAKPNDVRPADYHPVTVVDVDHIEFNDVNAAGFKAWTSGGVVQFDTPQDLTGYSPRMDMKDKIGGTVLASSEVDASPLDIIDLTVDPVEFKTTMVISAVDTAGIVFDEAITDLEMVGPTGDVAKLKLTTTGKDEEPDPVRVVGEVTT